MTTLAHKTDLQNRIQPPRFHASAFGAKEPFFKTGRFLCWTEDVAAQSERRASSLAFPSQSCVGAANRLQAFMERGDEDGIAAYYNYTADSESIVTIGIRPSRPETGYGYVEAGDSVQGEIVRVRSFKEKPNLDVAKQYLAAGNYLWNAGIFVWNVRTITRCITTYKPSIAAIMERMKSDADVQAFFPQCEKISIDYAVMEPAAADGRVYTHPADFGWSDLGNWASLHEKLSHDEDGNGAVGPVHLYECHDCVVHAEDANKVVLQGLDGFIVSAKGGRLLVCRRSEEQRIKKFSQQ